MISGTHVHIPWNWGGFSADLDMCELEVDRGQAFVLLAYDTTPTKWAYRAIYRVGDSRVGQWSNPVSVTVGG